MDADLRDDLPETWYANPRARSWTCAAARPVRDFHRRLPGYAPTPLTEVPSLAAELGLGRVFVKDESSRLGLPAFKALGASWAIHQILASPAAGDQAGAGGTGAHAAANGDSIGHGPLSLDELRDRAAQRPGLVFVTATDGNHGRAVARVARLLATPAHIFVPLVMSPAARALIKAEGATVTQVAGSYDEAVAAAARWAAARPAAALVQDTAWPGYQQVPGWIVAGYSTLFAELDEQLARTGAGPASLVAVPVGVGSLAQAAVTHYRSPAAAPGTALLAVEPDTAACLLASLRAGTPVQVPTGATIMAGLNCGTVSAIAWPFLSAGLDAAVAVSDAVTAQAVTDLATAGIHAGPCGAASLAGLRAALTGPGGEQRRSLLTVNGVSVAVLLSTEAAG